MTKLTKDMRHVITIKAMAGFMKQEKEALAEKLQAFGIELYEHEYGAAEASVMALPEEWREVSEVYRLRCDGFEHKSVKHDPVTDKVSLTGDPHRLSDRLQLGKRRPFPSANFGEPHIRLKNDHPLYAKSQLLVKEHSKIVAREEEVCGKIHALLASCNTIKQLEAAWPEALDYLPKGVAMSTALVPVGLSDQINKALGIPSKASVATKATRKAAAQ